MSDTFINQLNEAGGFFIYNFIELTVLFLGVSFLVEILNLFLDPKKVQKLLSSNRGGYIIASAMGALTPFCSCSSIPLTIGLIKAKASFGPIMTFLFTSPLLNPIVVAVFWSAFGLEVTLVYSFIALFVSIFAGILLEKLGFEKYIKQDLFQNDEPIVACCSPAQKSATPKAAFSMQKPQNVSSFSIKPKEEKKPQSKWQQIFNKTMFNKTWKQFLSFAPYIAIGIGIGAFVHGFVPEELLTKYASAENIFAVPVSAIIGIPLYIRASSMVGLAPALLDGGVSMGAILALTVAGAGASLPEMVMLKKIFKMPIMIFFVIAVFSMAIGCGYLVNLYFS